MCPPLARALAEHAYIDPTPVQTAVLEPQATGHDLLVSAQTGSGKTVAYGLAIATNILGDAETVERAGDPMALVVAPTRELALQVHGELTWLYRYTGARVIYCVGGMDTGPERRQLASGVHIVVGTPGRLRDHLERGNLKISNLKALVLDEADEMLDLGFREDLEFILKTTPQERRTLLFSATLPRGIVTLAKNYQLNALRIDVSGTERAHADIEYRAIRIAAHNGGHAIVNLLRFYEAPGALIFCNTREAVRRMTATLLERGFPTVSLSGELSQAERNHAMLALRSGRARVCVATDVAARGIDLPGLDLVIHAELPNDPEVLQHRSGRTGRAGRKGVSVVLVNPAARRHAERLLNAARIQAAWSGPPTVEEIKKLDLERMLRDPKLADEGSEEDRAMAQSLLATHSPETVARAFIRLYFGQSPAPEDLVDPGSAPDRYPPRDRVREPHGRKPEPHARPSAPTSATSAPVFTPASVPGIPGKTTWFRLNVGRQKKADPKWLLPEICRQGKVIKKDIGAIRIFDDETRFEINEDVAERFAEAITQAKVSDIRIEASTAPTQKVSERPRPTPSPLPTPTPEGRLHGTIDASTLTHTPRERRPANLADKPSNRYIKSKKYGDKRGKPGAAPGEAGKAYLGKPKRHHETNKPDKAKHQGHAPARRRP